MNTTERAKEIRTQLKRQHGWNSRQVSVRAKYFSMGSSIDVRINDPAVPIAPVEKIANAHKRISRCEYSGEILSGGNRYVSVSYDHEALKARALPYLPAVTAALAQATGSALIPVEGTKFMIGRDQFDRPQLWADHYLATAHSAEGLAETIATQA